VLAAGYTKPILNRSQKSGKSLATVPSLCNTTASGRDGQGQELYDISIGVDRRRIVQRKMSLDEGFDFQ
jgi:hypothetical protein